jgi:hypothetical protein
MRNGSLDIFVCRDLRSSDYEEFACLSSVNLFIQRFSSKYAHLGEPYSTTQISPKPKERLLNVSRLHFFLALNPNQSQSIAVACHRTRNQFFAFSPRTAMSVKVEFVTRLVEKSRHFLLLKLINSFAANYL